MIERFTVGWSPMPRRQWRIIDRRYGEFVRQFPNHRHLNPVLTFITPEQAQRRADKLNRQKGKQKMETYLIPCGWRVTGRITVEANSLEEAKEKIFNKDQPLQFPESGCTYYVGDSIQIDEEGLDYDIERAKAFREFNQGKRSKNES